jgi:4-alpha-glucanotransferase
VGTVLIGDSEEAVLRLEAVLTEYLKGVFIDSFMGVTRKSWIPAGHEGSQSQEHDEYRLLMAATTMVLDAEQKQWAEDFGEDAE